MHCNQCPFLHQVSSAKRSFAFISGSASLRNSKRAVMEMVGSPPTCCGISCAGHSSCITISNLGQVSFPDAVRRELVRLDFLLTPRAHSPYNCGIASVGDTLSLTITRRGKEAGVEK